jgi:putative tryptophan/tyrosine transport system substrate-binding protein
MRRIGLVLAISLALAPLAVDAQAGKAFRIGVLSPGADEPAFSGMAAFRQALRELGYVIGENIALEIRFADGRHERLPDMAAELVSLKVDVILAASNPAIAAAQKATTSIPTVMTTATDPVAVGFVASLSRPGGNITGLTVQTPDVAGKRLQLLKEAVPNLPPRVAILWDPDYPGGRLQVNEAQAAARRLGVQFRLVEARSPDQLDGAFKAMASDRAGGAFIAGSDMLFRHRGRIAELAAKRRLPTTCPLREWVEAGCLIGYGTSVSEQWRRAAYFVDRILKGTKPGDLPIEQPTTFELVINLKTAKALGLTIPPSVLGRADQVIE